jgi:propanol-preferring alcohol dehydrogenase
MCHSDCHIIKGLGEEWLTKKPTTLGHEVAGVTTKLGPAVTDYNLGDRVVVSLIGYPIQERTWSICIGIGFDGGYAEYAVVPVSHLVRISEGVSFEQAAVATDALATSYHAVMVEADAKPGTVLGVVGLGGLGLSGLALGVISGVSVYGFDIVEAKLRKRRRSGLVLVSRAWRQQRT